MTVHTSVNEERAVGTITIDRPTVQNALDPETLTALIEGFETFGGDPAVNVVVVEGANGVFCAGADINEFERRVNDPRGEAAFVETIHEVYDAVEDCPVPVIAKVEGAARGAGCEIALAADLRVGATDASLGLSEIDVALVPPFERISQFLGKARVREMCFTADPLYATEDAATVVFNRVVAPEDVDDATADLAEAVAEKSPHALRTTKRALRHGESVSKAESLAYRSRLEYECFDHPDFGESLRAFQEKREPDYRRVGGNR